jgi:hypothetical protein
MRKAALAVIAVTFLAPNIAAAVDEDSYSRISTSRTKATTPPYAT